MSSRSPARWLAPLALLAAVVAVALTVTAALGDGGDEVARPATSTTTSADGGTARDRGRDDADRAGSRVSGSRSGGGSRSSYTIKAGDTLATIAEATGVSVEELQELNPDLDPQALTVGQRLRLRR
jgi:hypothetical protein